MNPAAHILAVAVLVLVGGCSKKNPVSDDASKKSGDGIGDSPPKISKIQPSLNNDLAPVSGSITRQADGLWHESAAGKIFTGNVVYIQDSIRWEEKIQKGVRVFVKAWDEDGQPVELHAWNADGSPGD